VWGDLFVVFVSAVLLLDYYCRRSHAVLCVNPKLDRRGIRVIFWLCLILSVPGVVEGTWRSKTLPVMLGAEMPPHDIPGRVAMGLIPASISIQLAAVVAMALVHWTPLEKCRPRPVVATLIIASVATGLLLAYVHSE